MKIYLARKMTGLTGREIVEKSQCARSTAKILLGTQTVILDPVHEEGVKPTDEVVKAPAHLLTKFWSRDKQMIREAHVVIDMTGSEKSEGVAHEIGYARYCLWKPVVRVYPELGKDTPSVARIEDDVIATSYEEALFLVDKYWGTFGLRFLWRLKMLFRCVPRWLAFQLREFK